MASLDNFHTNNGPQPHYPGQPHQMHALRAALHGSRARDWDLANAVPVAPAPSGGTRSHIDPQIQERLNPQSLNGYYYVPTQPRTYARRGDTVEASVQPVGSVPAGGGPAWLRWWDTAMGRMRARIPTVSRFHPYIR